jgi:hypothetical protein
LQARGFAWFERILSVELLPAGITGEEIAQEIQHAEPE